MGLFAVAQLMQTVFRNHSILIRPFSTNDGPGLCSAARESIAELCAWMTWCSPTYSVAEATAFVAQAGRDWESGMRYCFAIAEAASGTLLGSIGLTQINQKHQFANVGVWVRTARTSQGIATEATRMLVRFAFEELRLRRLEFVVAAANLPSVRAVEKIGAKREGVLRQRLSLAGEVHDAFLYALVA